ncbi:MAG: glutamate racemase [Armatimonadetes bacterium]|nr:glutamate racemase [Candidatus Hippobium faecium]
MKIGMYDSGIGGLTVAAEVIKRIPDCHIIYVADNYNVPYGDKRGETIREFSCGISSFLNDMESDTICIACNMSTAYSLETIREKFPEKSVYGTIEFGGREALKYSDRIGVIATAGTVKSGAYTDFIKSVNKNAYVCEEPCPEFVPLVEKGLQNSEEAYETVENHIGNLLKKGNIDALILGCTHYPFLWNQIKKVLPENVRIINPAAAMADFLRDEGVYRSNAPAVRLFATKDGENVSLAWQKLTGQTVPCKLLVWDNNRLVI